MSCFEWCPCLGGSNRTKSKTSQPALVYLNEKKSLKDIYNVEEKPLGEGAFGKVWAAVRCKNSSEKVAVKGVAYVGSEYSSTPNSDEVIAMQRLDHPHVCRIMETFADDMYLYLVMEFCYGGDLFSKVMGFIDSDTRLPFRDAASYMRQIFSAVAHMHALDVGHLDLKLENVLLSDSTPGALLKVVDFGLSQFIKRGDIKTGAQGSPHYVAPEVLCQSYDVRADNWSCGVIMYVLLSSEMPFAASNSDILSHQILHKKIECPTDAGPTAESLLNSLLKRDVHARMTARKALRHAWLREELGADEIPKLKEAILDGLGSYAESHSFKRLVWREVVERTEDQQVRKFQEEFRILDSEGQGFLTVDDLLVGFTHLDKDPADLKKLVEKHVQRIHDNGLLQYSDFIAAALVGLKYTPTEKALKSTFHFFDRSGMEAISFDDVERVLRFDDKKHEASAIIEMIDQVDADGDRRLSYTEFLAFLGIKRNYTKLWMA